MLVYMATEPIQQYIVNINCVFKLVFIDPGQYSSHGGHSCPSEWHPGGRRPFVRHTYLVLLFNLLPISIWQGFIQKNYDG